MSSNTYAFYTGVLTITNPNPTIPMTTSEWSQWLNFRAYRLNIDSFLPHSCPKFTNGQYTRRFEMYIID